MRLYRCYLMGHCFLFLFFLLALGGNCKAQSNVETISFINQQIVESTKSAMDYFIMNETSLSSTGKLTVETYMFMDNNWVLMESRSGYLKKMKVEQVKSINLPDKSVHYVIILRCSDLVNCVSRQVKSQPDVDNYNEIGIIVYSRQCTEKIRSAFLHLLDQAKTNQHFLTKDPFE